MHTEVNVVPEAFHQFLLFKRPGALPNKLGRHTSLRALRFCLPSRRWEFRAWVPGIQTQVLKLARQAFYWLKHLSSSQLLP